MVTDLEFAWEAEENKVTLLSDTRSAERDSNAGLPKSEGNVLIYVG